MRFSDAPILYSPIEPSHEIIVLFVLRKLILQSHMRSYPMGLDVWCLVRPYVYFHTSYVRTAKALARLRACAGSPVSSLVANVISTIISWAGSIRVDCNSTVIHRQSLVRQTCGSALLCHPEEEFVKVCKHKTWPHKQTASTAATSLFC